MAKPTISIEDAIETTVSKLLKEKNDPAVTKAVASAIKETVEDHQKSNKRDEAQKESDFRYLLQQHPKGGWRNATEFDTQWCIFENYVKSSGVSEKRALTFLSSILPLELQKAWFMKKDTSSTLDEAKQKLLKLLGFKKSDFVAETLYRERYQRPNESVADFYRDLSLLLTEAGGEDKIGGIACFAADFEYKLSDRLRYNVLRKRTGDSKDTDPNEILRRAQEEEEVLRQEDRKKGQRTSEDYINIQNIGPRKPSYQNGKPGFNKPDTRKSKKQGCFICGDPGHFKRDCPQKAQGNGQRTIRTGTNRSITRKF